MQKILLPLLAFTLIAPQLGHAHKAWLRPSQTVLSGADPWITVDAAVSNDLFYFNHFPLRLEGLIITAPDGQAVAPQNQSVGKYRSVFDLPLTQTGTYRIAVVNAGLSASWLENGQVRRFRGNAAAFEQQVPSDASELKVTESLGRIETFVTHGGPTEAALQPTSQGIELVPITHPNDLYAGEEATFQLLVNGQPQSGLEIEVIRGETRYRDAQDEIQATTDAEGKFSVTWPAPGMYWFETSVVDQQPQHSRAQSRRMSYAATLEVLPQ